MRASPCRLTLWAALAAGGFVVAAAAVPAAGDKPRALFDRGVAAYAVGDFDVAVECFEEAAARAPAPGTLHNLGNAQWQAGRTGPAVRAWEQARLLNPFAARTRGNLRFARGREQLAEPELAWYEVCSTWLPVSAWAWIAAVSLWIAAAMTVLPVSLRWRRADWHQGVTAAALAVFLLALPACVGVHTRAALGVVMTPDAPLRLTPTGEAEVTARLPAGDTARVVRARGDYLCVRAGGDLTGWLRREDFGPICGAPPIPTRHP